MNKKFCPLPWISEAVRNNGDLRVCCHAKASKSQGVYRKADGSSFNATIDSLDEARNSELAKELRLSMLNNSTHDVCTRCDQEDASGIRSRRQYETENWSHFFTLDDATKLTNDDGSIDPHKVPIAHYDLRFGNLCNLKCRMCGPTDSNQWYEDHVKVWGGQSFKDSHGKVELIQNQKGRWITKNNDYDWIDSENFWQQLENKVHDLQHVYIVGGEPLLIDQHYEMLQLCVDKGAAKNIMVEYNTNITNIPQRAWDIWKHFKRIQIGASIDGINDINDYIRYPSKFSKISENLHKFDQAEGNFNIWVACTIQAYNVHHVPQFMKWMVEQDFKRVQSNIDEPFLTPHPLHNPKHLNMRILPPEAKEYIRNAYDEFINWVDEYSSRYNDPRKIKGYQNRARKILNGYHNYMIQEDWSDQLPKFWEYTKKLDELRNQSYEETFPEMYEFIKKYV